MFQLQSTLFELEVGQLTSFRPLASFKNLASKARGNRSLIDTSSFWPRKFARTIVACLANSQMICRQVPHGGVKSSVSATTTRSVKSRSPSESAFQIAT